MIEPDEAFRRSVGNIAAWGDTDVFPLPPENLLFYDRTDRIVELLTNLDENFEEWRDDQPPDNAEAMAMVGYTSFRWVTQVDPIWNAYLLGLVLRAADDLEHARIPRDQQTVYSYRYDYDPETHRLFAESAWRDFNVRSVELASQHSHVVVCDIADFYARVYHHRLENALLDLKIGSDIPHRIDRVLALFSQGPSYGLPVGGPAARLLSEILLNRVDRLLMAEGIPFARFADDYHLFMDSREDAYDGLRFLSEKLLQNEGLTLQRAKTRILSGKDFSRASAFATAHEGEGETADEQAQRSFLALSLRYDPYSPTAKEDYASLREQVERYDILGMLARELSKSRIHSALTRRLLQAIGYLEPDARNAAVRSLIDNIETLAPVFPNVMRAVTGVWEELDAGTRSHITAELRSMIGTRRYYVMVPVNLAHAVRVLGNEHSIENEALLAQLYESAPDFVQRDVMLIMGRWDATWWLSDQLKQFSHMNAWARRAFLVCSHLLGDEGVHWRRRIRGRLSPLEAEIMDWAHARGPRDVPL